MKKGFVAWDCLAMSVLFIIIMVLLYIGFNHLRGV